jgi:hypothetical protein
LDDFIMQRARYDIEMRRLMAKTIQGVSLLVLGSLTACVPSTGSRSSVTTDSYAKDEANIIAFSAINVRQSGNLAAERDAAIRSAAKILHEYAEGEPIEEDMVEESIALLKELEAADAEAVKSLIANLEFTPEVSVTGEPDGLEGLPAARALRAIGGRNVVRALLQSLRRIGTKKEELITAHILASCDTAEVAAFRVGLAIEAECSFAAQADRHYIKRLEAVKLYLDQPELMRDPKRWPNTMPSTKRVKRR